MRRVVVLIHSPSFSSRSRSVPTCALRHSVCRPSTRLRISRRRGSMPSVRGNSFVSRRRTLFTLRTPSLPVSRLRELAESTSKKSHSSPQAADPARLIDARTMPFATLAHCEYTRHAPSIYTVRIYLFTVAIRALQRRAFPVYSIFDAHPLTLMFVMAAVMVTPLHVAWTFAISGAPFRKGVILAAVVLPWGALMTWVCMAGIVNRFEPPIGSLIVPIAWITPSLGLWLMRDWVFSHPLSQRMLVGLQVWRVVGGVFLIEMSRGQLPPIFALPAGIGDVAVGLTAAAVLWRYRKAKSLPRRAVVLVATLGLVDFAVAFILAFTSTPGPQQIFFPEVMNKVLTFPTGMIPLFLVPYAIAFHTLSIIALRRER